MCVSGQGGHKAHSEAELEIHLIGKWQFLQHLYFHDNSAGDLFQSETDPVLA